jgi:cytochrome c oxidase cbb3-type subunit 1
MTLTLAALLALTFLISVLGLFVFIWAQSKGLLTAGPRAAEVIFAPNEVGTIEDPSGSDTSRLALQSTRDAALSPAELLPSRSSLLPYCGWCWARSLVS